MFQSKAFLYVLGLALGLLLISMIQVGADVRATDVGDEGRADSKVQHDEAVWPAVTVQSVDGSPIDFAEHVHPRLTRLSVRHQRGTDIRPSDHCQLQLTGTMEIQPDELRVWFLHWSGRVTRLIDGNGKPIRYRPIAPARGNFEVVLAPNGVIPALQSTGRGVAPSFMASVYLDGRAGPIISQIDIEFSAVVAKHVDIIDVPLPDKAFDAKADKPGEGKAFEPIELWPGTELRLVRYSDEPYCKAEYRITTDMPDTFNKGAMEKEGKLETRYALAAPSFLKDGKLFDMGVATPWPKFSDKAAEMDIFEGSVTYGPRSQRGEPDTIRFYVARDVRVVRFTATIKDLDIGVIANAKQADGGDKRGAKSDESSSGQD